MSGTTNPEKAREDAEVADERICGTCRYYRPLPKQGACCLNPPVVHIITVMESPLDPKSIKQLPANTRPTTERTDTCSHHKFSDELSDAEMVAQELEHIAQWLREGITGRVK